MLSVGGEDILSGVHARFGTNCFHTRQESNMFITIRRDGIKPHALVMTPDTLRLEEIAAPEDFVTFVNRIDNDGIKRFTTVTFQINEEKRSLYSSSFQYYFTQLQNRFRSYHRDLVAEQLALSTAPTGTRGWVTGTFPFRVTENSNGKVSIHIETPAVIDFSKMEIIESGQVRYNGNYYEFQDVTQEERVFSGVRLSRRRGKRRSRGRRRRSRRHETPVRLRR